MRLFAFLYALFAVSVMMPVAAVAFLMLLPFAAIPRGRRERYTIVIAQWFIRVMVQGVLATRVVAVGTENLPEKRGYLVASNHRSWTDVGVLILTTASVGISKKEIAWVPFFGLGGHLAGAIFFDRKDKEDRAKVVREALLMLGRGANLHVFPEGTRTRDGRIREKVYLKLLSAAWEAGIPVVPACVWDTEKVLPATGLLAYPGRTVGVEIAAPLPPGGFADGTAFAEATWAKVVEMARVRGADGVDGVDGVDGAHGVGREAGEGEGG